MAKNFKFSLIDLIKLTKGRKNYFLMIVFVIFSNSLFANGEIGYKGIYINNKGTKTWYKAHDVTWGYNGCGDYQFYNAADFNSQNLGSFTSIDILQISGFAVVGWTDNSDYISGKLLYKVWRDGNSEPITWSEYAIGNYNNPAGGVQDVVCSNSNDRVVGQNFSINLNSGAPGIYYLKIQALGRMQYTGGGGGFFNPNDGPEMTAAFTITSSTTDQFRSSVTGNWNSIGSWESSSNGTNWAAATIVPGADASSITILDGHTITLDANVTAKSLTINSGGTFTASDATPKTLTLSSGGTLTNYGTFVHGSGTVSFLGSGTISGTVTLYNVEIGGGVNFGSGSTVNGVLQLNAGSYVNTNAPTYATGSTLRYNTGTDYSISSEWYADQTSGAGVPYNVDISSSTQVHFTGSQDHTMNGTFTIGSGKIFSLSTDFGADFFIKGDFINNGGTFNANSRLVTFNGTTEQEIQSDAAMSFAYLTIDNSAGVSINSNGLITVANNLTINNSRKLTINAGKSLTVTGTLTNSAGNTGIVIKSDASGTGSLITANGVGATVERFLTKYDVVGDQMFHLISSPVAAQAIRPEFVSNAATIPAGTDFYSFSESTNEWINTRAAGDIWNTAFEDNFTIGKGYLVAYPTNVTKNFTGALNSAEVVLTCSNTAPPTGGNGWNLLGNPFPSAIDWNALSRSAGLDNALYYYDNAEQKYRYYLPVAGDGTSLGSGSRYIPAMQGFMVHASTNGATLTIPTAAKTHNGQNIYYKSTATVPGSLSLKVAANGHEDEAFIHFNSQATTAFDGSFDAYKLKSYSSDVPNLYTKGSDGSELAINGLPELSETTTIPVYLEYKTAGTYTFTADLSGISGTLVFLNDLKENTFVNLTQNPAYQFAVAEGDAAERFSLTFGSVGTEDPEQEPAALVYAVDKTIFIVGAEKDAQLILTDISGKMLKQVTTSGESRVSINAASLPKGVYIVTVQGEGAQVSRKVVL